MNILGLISQLIGIKTLRLIHKTKRKEKRERKKTIKTTDIRFLRRAGAS